MAPLPDYVAGTITLTNNSTAFTGAGTGWLAAGFREGDTILGIEDNPGVTYVVESVTDNDSGTLTQPWDGPTGTYTYRMRYLSDGQRVTAQARQLIEMLGNGNLQAVAGLPGTPNTFMMFTGTGSVVEVPRTDLVSGANYDVQVDTLAERAAYDGSDEGFAVLVANTGDGRAAIYSKNSATSGDWSDPAYVTGPAVTLDVGSVTPVAFGNDPDVTLTPVAGGYEFDFELPENATFQSGTITTLDPGEDATFSLSPVAGGYALNLGVPRGPTGDIDGVTPFWQGRITVDANAAAARAGLGITALGLGTGAIDFPDLTSPEVAVARFFRALSGATGGPGVHGGVVSLPDGGGGSAKLLLVGNDRAFFGGRTGANPDPLWREFWTSYNLPEASKAEAEDGGGLLPRAWSPKRIAQAIAALVWAAQPIGVPIPLWTHLDGVDEPPADQDFRYIKLTASDAYNTDVLTGENVSGSAPLVQATAVISLADSPLNGQTVRLINTERRVLRAGISGVVENDQFQSFRIGVDSRSIYVTSGGGGAHAPSVGSPVNYAPVADGVNGTPRTGNETRPKNIGADYYMRIR